MFKFVVRKIYVYSPLDSVNLLMFLVFFIQSSYKVKFCHVCFGHLNNSLKFITFLTLLNILAQKYFFEIESKMSFFQNINVYFSYAWVTLKIGEKSVVTLMQNVLVS